MGKSSRGRRAVAEQLGMLDEKRAAASRGGDEDVEPGGGRRGAGVRAKGRQRRGKLPSDRAIASTMIVRIIRWIFKLAAFCILASVALVIIYRVVDPPITPLM